MISKIEPYWKAAVAFISLLGTVLVTLAADPNIRSVLPASTIQWCATAGAIIVGTFAVFAKANKPTVEQAQQILADAQSRAGTP